MADLELDTSRFHTLQTMGKIISAMGWIVVSAGGLFGVVAMVAIAGLQGRRGSNGLAVIAAGGPGLLVATAGMLVVAAGQAISCFISIERNTHAACEVQSAVLKSLTGHSLPTPSAPVLKEVVPPVSSVPVASALPAPSAWTQVLCPKCKASESVGALHDVTRYSKFDAEDKSSFGFESVSLTCKNCGYVFRV